MTRPIGLAALTVLELPPPEAVRCAAAAGYDSVGLRLIPATDAEPRHPTIGRTRMVRETLRALEETGMTVMDIEILRLTPESAVAADFEPFLETGAFLGASQILVAGNDDDRSRLAANFAELADLAAGYGLTPNIEFMPWTSVPSLADAASLLRRVDHENVGLLIDSLHFDRSGSRSQEIAALKPHWFRYFQLCDATADKPASTADLLYEARHGRLLPGEGALDLLGPLRRLPADLPVSIEAPVATPRPVPALQRAVAALGAARTVLAGLDGGPGT
ncbi:MAG: sugar phosphate isomerase/epimerase family protein, partial [Actinomycetales bacterium]